LRVPRTVSAIAVGGGLAVAGALIQASLANPLADPYTIGVASAAALGAVIGSFFREHHLLGSSVVGFAFALGGLFLLATWLRRSFRHASEVLLAGVVASFFFSSLATLVLTLADPATWSTSMLWIMGSLGRLSLGEAAAALLAVVFVCAAGWYHWKPLDLISVDELAAESAGVDVALVRRRLFVFAALITAVSVSVAGVIGFLGLIVPHALRAMGVRGHHALLPISFVAGAGVLLCSDVLARVAARPSELPVGVVMAVIGAPIFLILARRKGALP
jgi:iron complex transport system permease protein